METVLSILPSIHLHGLELQQEQPQYFHPESFDPLTVHAWCNSTLLCLFIAWNSSVLLINTTSTEPCITAHTAVMNRLKQSEKVSRNKDFAVLKNWCEIRFRQKSYPFSIFKGCPSYYLSFCETDLNIWFQKLYICTSRTIYITHEYWFSKGMDKTHYSSWRIYTPSQTNLVRKDKLLLQQNEKHHQLENITWIDISNQYAVPNHKAR